MNQFIQPKNTKLKLVTIILLVTAAALSKVLSHVRPKSFWEIWQNSILVFIIAAGTIVLLFSGLSRLRPYRRKQMTIIDKMGRSDLHNAVIDKNSKLVRSLIDSGNCNVNQADKDGRTPLHSAAQEGTIEIAELLLEANTIVDAQDAHGNTPLFNAVFNSRGKGEMIALLRRYGADPHKANHHGQTPYKLAKLIANYPVAQFFADLEGAS